MQAVTRWMDIYLVSPIRELSLRSSLLPRVKEFLSHSAAALIPCWARFLFFVFFFYFWRNSVKFSRVAQKLKSPYKRWEKQHQHSKPRRRESRCVCACTLHHKLETRYCSGWVCCCCFLDARQVAIAALDTRESPEQYRRVFSPGQIEREEERERERERGR